MFCPFNSLLLAQGRYKVQAMAAIRRGVAKQKLHVRDLDDLLSAVYVEVTTALHENGPDFFTNTLIFFITTVNEPPALKSWTKRLSVNRFISLPPRCPAELAQHSLATLQSHGPLQARPVEIRVDEDEEPAQQEGQTTHGAGEDDDDSDDGLFVKQADSTPALEDDGGVEMELDHDDSNNNGRRGP